jgi:cellulose biosynthesis protein BcsQ
MRPVRVTMADRAIRPAQAAIPLQQFRIARIAVLVADLVIIPVRPAFLDMNATESLVGTCKKRRKRYAFLVNAFDGRPAFKKSNTDALGLLDGQGPVFNVRLPYSAKFIEGQSAGKTGPEVDKALAAPIDALIDEIKEMIGMKDARQARSAHA